MITASDVSKLRSITGVGMMDCKNALEEANGDVDKAAELLRKKGMIKAAKKADRIAAEGLVQIVVKDNVAVMLEVNSETDFVAENAEFKKVISDLANHILVKKPADLEEAMSQPMEGFEGTVQDYINSAIAKIGEKLSFRRFVLVEKGDNEALGDYTHMGGKIGVLVLLSGTTDESLAKDIAMHAAASNPKFLDRDSVSPEVIEAEKEVYAEQLKREGKPENMIENIVKGKLNKFYSEICLLEQPFIKDEDKKVSDLLGEGVSIKAFYRFELGEGIEKKENDFAKEVQEQAG